MPKISTLAIGGYGLKHNSGRINEEFHRSLTGTKGIKIYREMTDNDPIIGGILFAIESLIRSASYSVKPAIANDDRAKEWADFLEGCIQDLEIDWQNLLSEIMSCLTYGWSFFEVVYKYRKGERSRFTDGKIGWAQIASRAQETLDRWEIAPDGRILGMYQQLENKTVFLPIEKCLLFRTRIHKNSPEGRSILRNSYRAWYFKKKLEEIEAIGIERNIAGLPVLQVPPRLMDPNASAEDVAIRGDLEKLVQEVRMDERMGLVIPAELDDTGQPTGYKFGLLASSGKSDVSADVVIRRWDSRIAASVLADFIMLAIDKVGAFSTFKGKANLFGIALTTILDGVYLELNRHAVLPLMKLNGCPEDLVPTIEHGDISQAELSDISTYVQALGSTGFLTPTKELEDELLRRGSLPLSEEGQIARTDDVDLEAEVASEESLEPSQLNSAQITSLVSTVSAVASQQIPRESGIGIVMLAFKVDRTTAESLLGSAGKGFEPASLEPTPIEKRAEQPANHVRAHNALNSALRAGTVKRKPCEKCGAKKSEAHHEDYDDPLNVKWLCRPCHMEYDAREQRESKKRQK